jgi:hypothetical protein
MWRYTWMVVILCACRGNGSVEPEDPGHAYFPDRVGTWVEYQVDSIWRDDWFQVYDSVSYRMKQVVAAHYVDPAGRNAMRIERFKWINGQWLIRDVWTGVRSATGLEIAEENERKLKISFPVREGRRWDVNVLNTLKELEVAARDVGTSYTLNGQTHGTTFLVKNTVPVNLVERRDLEERYASGIGMIEHYWHSDWMQWYDDGEEPDTMHVSVIYSLKAVAHGVE